MCRSFNPEAPAFLSAPQETEMPNTNCLEGIRCPKCGHEDSFKVEAKVLVLVEDEGVTHDLSPSEFDADHYCECNNCYFSGTIKDFTLPAAQDDVAAPTSAERDKLIALNAELLEALQDVLGDRPSVQGGICQHCGRDYIAEFIEGDCDSGDCAGVKARILIAQAKDHL
jgi:hypothetical protein